MKLQRKFTLYLAVAFLVVIGLSVFLSYKQVRNEARIRAYETCEIILAEVESARAYVREVLRPMMYDLVGERFIPEAMSTSYAARSQAEIFLRKYPDYYVKFASLNPRNPLNRANDLEEEIIEYFRSDPDADIWHGVNIRDGMEYLTVATPYRFKESCLRCHGRPEDAPPELIERYGNKNGFGITVGDLTINSVGVPITVTYSEVWGRSLMGILPMSALFGIMFIVTTRLFKSLVTNPVEKLKKGVDSIADGNYSVRIDVSGSEDIRDLAHAYNKMAEKIDENIAERRKAEEELRESRSDLSVLYKVSSAVGRTIDMKKLLTIILETITGIEIFDVEPIGGIFLVEDDRMKLVSHLGHPEEFLDLHRDMRVGDCLCGLAAEKGEIIISGNCGDDRRHTLRYSSMAPHGHVIIPLKAKTGVKGVLYLYLPADFKIEESRLKLFDAIGNQICIAIENARLYEETKRFALHDSLTGLANRRYMDIVLERSFAQAKRSKRPFSVIMADIDHFKEYNDTYGHPAGDRLLITLAELLQKDTRAVDLVSRYGGEEFLILLSEADLKKAIKVAEGKRRVIEADTDVTISLGVAQYSEEIKTKEELIQRADEVLYQAKQNGRNRVEVSD